VDWTSTASGTRGGYRRYDWNKKKDRSVITAPFPAPFHRRIPCAASSPLRVKQQKCLPSRSIPATTTSPLNSRRRSKNSWNSCGPRGNSAEQVNASLRAVTSECTIKSKRGSNALIFFTFFATVQRSIRRHGYFNKAPSSALPSRPRPYQ
jgi:hypothetical protein